MTAIEILIKGFRDLPVRANSIKILITAFLMIMFAVSTAFATAQAPDRIVYEGTKYSLHTNPMESYFREHPDKKPKRGSINTALWRGYVATFEVKDGSLFLKDIEIEVHKRTEDGKREYTLKSVTNELVPEGQVLQIDWFTGILVLPYGELVSYVHLGYGSSYSNYILLEVKGGRVTGERRLDYIQYEQFKERQFEAYKKTEAYRKQVAKLKSPFESRKSVDSFLRSFVVDYTSEFLDEGP